MRYVQLISGKDSLCTAIVQMEREPNLPYEFLFNPTGCELPEVFEWLKMVEIQLGIKIHHVGVSLEERIKHWNYFLPSRIARYCTRECKIDPMTKWIGGEDAIVYYGIRADENRGGYDNLKTENITPCFPLKEEGIDLLGVYQIINNRGLKPPTFFCPITYELVKRKLGFDPRPMIPEWIFDQLFAWRSRANCDRCHEQRQYEIVGLWEYHPERAKRIEKTESMGKAHKDDPDYTIREHPWRWFKDNADRIRNKRANAIAKIIAPYIQSGLFDTMDENDLMHIMPGSCGLFCAK